MKFWTYPIVIYLVICTLLSYFGHDDYGYNVFMWKFYLLQYIGIPLMIVYFVVAFIIRKRRLKKQ